MTEVNQNDQCCQHRCFNSDSQTLFYLPQKAVLQGADHHTEIYGAHFLLLCSETYTISRETNTGAALIWERRLDVKRQQTTVPIRTAVTRCLDVKVKSYSRSRLHSLRHWKNTQGKKILALSRSRSKLRGETSCWRFDSSQAKHMGLQIPTLKVLCTCPHCQVWNIKLKEKLSLKGWAGTTKTKRR